MHEVARQGRDLLPAGEGAADRYADMRAAPRHTLLIRSGKLIAFGMEFLCVVRDVSEAGVSVRIFHPLPDCPSMVLEMQNGDRLEVELVWCREDRAGFRFLNPIDVARIIELPSSFGRRPIRVRLSVPGILSSGFQQSLCELLDISQQGAKLSCAKSFAVQQRVKLTADGLPEIVAKILWRRGKLFGLVFENTFQFGELAEIGAALQQRYSMPEAEEYMRVPGAL